MNLADYFTDLLEIKHSLDSIITIIQGKIQILMPVRFNKFFTETLYKTDFTTPNIHNDRDFACVTIVIATGNKDDKIVTS